VADGPAGPELLGILRDLRSDSPSDPVLLDLLGWAKHRAEMQAEARAMLQAAVERAPEDPRPRYHLGVLLAQDNQRERARAEWQAAVDSKLVFPERFEAMRLLRETRAAVRPDPRGGQVVGN
jgi:Flp pilus assembly protein TadD